MKIQQQHDAQPTLAFPNDESDDDRSWFTPMLNSIAEIVGLKATMALARSRGGERIYIPEKVNEEHWLAEAMGLKAATKLVSELGPSLIVIPSALKGERIRRAKLIASLIEQGLSTNQIARIVGVSQSTIAIHRRRHAAGKGQRSSANPLECER